MAKPSNLGPKNRKARLARELHGVVVELVKRDHFVEGRVTERLREILESAAVQSTA